MVLKKSSTLEQVSYKYESSVAFTHLPCPLYALKLRFFDLFIEENFTLVEREAVEVFLYFCLISALFRLGRDIS